jgi:hypothetical protein
MSAALDPGLSAVMASGLSLTLAPEWRGGTLSSSCILPVMAGLVPAIPLA